MTRDPGDLEELLRSSAPRPSARPAFRQALWARFAAGELPCGEGSLSGRDGRTAAAVIEELLRRLPPPPAARAAFREELRAGFVRGGLRERPPATPRREPASARRLSPLARVLVGGLAAAAALWLIARVVLPRAPEWRATSAAGEGPVLVDGRAVDPRDLSVLGSAIAAGRVVESRARRVDLVRDGALALALLPGAVVERVSDGEDGADLRLSLRGGEVYLKTREGYAGPPVVVETPQADVRMVGTVIGVLVEPELACICVARGSVAIEPREDGGARTCLRDHRDLVLTGGGVVHQAFAELADRGGAHVRDLYTFAETDF